MRPHKIFALYSLFVLLLAGCDSTSGPAEEPSTSWESFSLTYGAQGSGSYGPLLNFDTAVDANMDQRNSMALGNEVNLDLVTAFIATGTGPNPPGVYKLLTPRLAIRMGITSTSGMDSTRLAAPGWYWSPAAAWSMPARKARKPSMTKASNETR